MIRVLLSVTRDLPSSNVCNNKPDALCGLQAQMSKEHSDATRRRDLDGEGDTLGKLDAEPRDSQSEEDEALNEDRSLVDKMQVDALRIRISCALGLGKAAPRVRRRFQNALSQARIEDTRTHPPSQSSTECSQFRGTRRRRR